MSKAGRRPQQRPNPDPFVEAMRLMRKLSQNASFGNGKKVSGLERRIDALLAESERSTGA